LLYCFDATKPRLSSNLSVFSHCLRPTSLRCAAQTLTALHRAAQAYNTLMTAFSALGDWQRAWSVVASMRRAGLAPDIWTYNTLLQACSRCAAGHTGAVQPTRIAMPVVAHGVVNVQCATAGVPAVRLLLGECRWIGVPDVRARQLVVQRAAGGVLQACCRQRRCAFM
jgi:pentatricopeptide repeat protein